MKVIAISSILILLLPSPILAGGRCSGSANNGFCICLDRNECSNRWGGVPVQGSPGDYPCPHDPANVWGCNMIAHCPGKSYNTACAYADVCGPRGGHNTGEPICPGGNEYFCCKYD